MLFLATDIMIKVFQGGSMLQERTASIQTKVSTLGMPLASLYVLGLVIFNLCES